MPNDSKACQDNCCNRCLNLKRQIVAAALTSTDKKPPPKEQSNGV